MELVVSRDLLGGLSTLLIEDDEMPDQIEEPILFKNPANQNLQFQRGLWREFFSFDGAPRHEPLLGGG